MLSNDVCIAAELNRVASSIAAVLAHALGNPGLDVAEARSSAARLVAEWLGATTCDIASDYALVDFGHDNQPKSAFIERAPAARSGSLRVAALPLDGASSLYRGRAGVMTWLALMEEAVFERVRKFVEKDSYFVFTVPAGGAFRQSRDAISKLHGQHVVKSSTRLVDFMKGPVLSELLPKAGLLAAHTMEAAAFRDGRPAMGKYCLGRSLDGSAVVSCIAPHTGRTDFGYCVCRGPGVPVIGAITKAAGGASLAFRIKSTGSPPMERVMVPSASQYVATESLFRDDEQVILCGGSVSEICVSDRVRWWSGGRWRPMGVAGAQADAVGCGTPHLSVSSMTFDTLRRSCEERCCHWDTMKIPWLGAATDGAKPLSDVIKEHLKKWEAMFSTRPRRRARRNDRADASKGERARPDSLPNRRA